MSRLLLLLLGAAVFVPALANAQPGDAELAERLDALQQLGYSGSWREVLTRLEALAPELDRAGPRARARHALLETRMLALGNNPDAAAERVRRLLDNPESLPPDLHLRALNLATNLLVFAERFEEGFEYFREALRRAPEIDAPAMRADTWNVAADFHNRIGEPATAMEYAERALAEIRTVEAPRQRCIADLRLATASEALGPPNASPAKFDRAIDSCESIPDYIFAGLAHLGRARAVGVSGSASGVPPKDPGRARHARAALRHFQRAEYVDGLLETHAMLAEAALARGDLAEAEGWLGPADAWLERSSSRALRATALEQRAELARRRGDLETAFEAARDAIALGRAHSTKTHQMRLTLLMSADEHARHERELDLLKAQNEASRLNQDARQSHETALAVGALATALAGVLLFVLVFRTARERRRFRERAGLDGLTGLLNHTRFFERAEQAFRRACQNHSALAMIVADVDLFKQINDRYGHLAGDQVLRTIGGAIRQAFGSDAIVGRIGGEEFGVVLPNTDIDEAVARIEHFRAMLNRDRSGFDMPEVTLSFGVAERSREKSLDVLYAHADQALYDAKEAGRNRVITVARIDLGAGAFVT